MGTITKALSLLDFFGPTRPEIGLSQFVTLSGRDKATVHRHLVELTENGFLEQNQETRSYYLGAAVLRLSAVREATHPAKRLAAPIVDALANETGELAHFTLIGAAGLTTVYHSDPQKYGVQVHFDPSEYLPYHATSSGLAALAFSDPGFQAKVLAKPLARFTDHTVTDAETFRTLIQRANTTGVCEMPKAFDADVRSRAIPIFGGNGFAIGALSVAVPSTRYSEEKQHFIYQALTKGSRKIIAALGGAIPAEHATKWSDDDS